MRTGVVAVLFAVIGAVGGGGAVGGCGSSDITPTSAVPQVDAGAPAVPDAAVDGGEDASDAAGDARRDGPAPLAGNLRIMAANTTSGPTLNYDPAESVRIFQGMHPDVVLIQELNVGDDSKTALDAFVSTTFGAAFTYYREQGAGIDIPNGIISRFPILQSGSWTDPQVANRGFAYAKLALPGPHPLWAVSLHLLTTGGTQRAAEAAALVTQVKAVIAPGDYLVVGGDFNTATRTEPCLTSLSEIVVTTAPYPDDGAGNNNTSGTRSKPHDWLLADPDLAPLGVPVVVRGRSFAAGLVFDSRVYMPLADVAPIQAGDSAAQNMQHMPVVRDFHVPQ